MDPIKCWDTFSVLPCRPATDAVLFARVQAWSREVVCIFSLIVSPIEPCKEIESFSPTYQVGASPTMLTRHEEHRTRTVASVMGTSTEGACSCSLTSHCSLFFELSVGFETTYSFYATVYAQTCDNPIRVNSNRLIYESHLWT